ncbi:MAG: YfhO family protein [Elusimicrobiota bacterium]|jgi:uncharacterized membrane protein YfhO|nr:YfhO family protein [Elusimicrobiota bacterium]
MKILSKGTAFENNSDKRKYYLAYSALFMTSAFLIYSWFFQYGNAIILDSDGIKQSYSTFLYFGRWLRIIFFNLLSFNFSIPLWDHNIGYGADIISTLHYYGIGDPLNFISFFTPEKYTELVYEMILISRLYFAGLFFSMFCFRMRLSFMQALIGSFVYVWSAFTLIGSLWLITGFMSAMIYLPLMLLGIEKILSGEKPFLLIISAFCALITNFYFFYMLSCIVSFYFIVRAYFTAPAENKTKHILKMSARFALNYATGIFLACLVFIPNFYLLIHSTRMKVQVFRFLYDLNYYKELTMSLFNVYPISFEWIFIGVSSMALFAFIALFMRKGKFLQVKIIFLFLSFCLIFPIGGKILHGFSYASLRWIWAYIFTAAFICSLMLPYLMRLKKKEMLAMSIIAALYIGLCILFYRDLLNIVKIGYVVTGVYLISFTAISFMKMKKSRGYAVILLLLCANIFLSAAYAYKYSFAGYKIKIGEIYPSVINTSHLSVKNINDADSFYRYEENPFGLDIYTNSSMLVGVKGTSYYYSLAVPYIYELLGDLEHYTEFDFMYYGLDGRTMMGALASVKYFIVADGAEQYLPFGFDENANSFKAHRRTEYHAYKTKNNLPLGYTYSKYIPYSVYENLDAVQRQEILLQGAVLKENLPPQFEKAQRLELRERRIPFYVNAADGLLLESNKMVGIKNGAAMQIVFNAPPNSETYIRFVNIIAPSNKEAMTVNVFSNGVNKKFEVYSPKFVRYIGKKNYIINMGYSKVAKTSSVITLPSEGTLTFDKMELVNLPFGKEYEAEIKTLKEDVLENVKLEGNEVSGEISLKTNKILVLSLPYNEGWEAWINGVKTPILRANIMYMGFPLQAGKYEIRLKYATPGIYLGAFLSLLGFIITALLFFKKSLLQKFKFLKGFYNLFGV